MKQINKHILSAVVMSMMLAAVASPAATIENPTLVQGPGDLVDPAGGETANLSFGTSASTLEARSDLYALNSFTGFTGGGTNTVSFTDNYWSPDIQFVFSGAYNTTSAGQADTGALFDATGDVSDMYQRNANPGSNTSTLTISFGTWNGSAFTADQTVSAAGFVLTQLYDTKSGTVTFLDATGSAISGANFNYQGLNNEDGAFSGNHRDIAFAWDAVSQSSAEIGSIAITFVDAGAEYGSGFDNLVFTGLIPEPATMGLLGIGGLALILRRKRSIR